MLDVASKICEKLALNQFSGFLTAPDPSPVNKAEAESTIPLKHW
jgi:hypothetical protein